MGSETYSLTEEEYQTIKAILQPTDVRLADFTKDNLLKLFKKVKRYWHPDTCPEGAEKAHKVFIELEEFQKKIEYHLEYDKPFDLNVRHQKGSTESKASEAKTSGERQQSKKDNPPPEPEQQSSQEDIDTEIIAFMIWYYYYYRGTKDIVEDREELYAEFISVEQRYELCMLAAADFFHWYVHNYEGMLRYPEDTGELIIQFMEETRRRRPRNEEEQTPPQKEPPKLHVTPTSLDFGRIKLYRSDSKELQVHNLGEEPLHWEVAYSPDWALISHTEESISVAVIAKEIGQWHDTLTITSNGGEVTINISLEVVGEFSFKSHKKTVRNAIGVTIGILLVVYAMVGWAEHVNDGHYWGAANRANTLKGYVRYMQRYPDGRFFDEAIHKAEEVIWNEAQEKDSFESYSFYLSLGLCSPDGIKEAKTKIEEKLWGEVLQDSTTEACEKYLQYTIGESLHYDEVRALRQDLYWAEALEKGGRMHIQYYLSRHDLGRHREEANELLKKLEREAKATPKGPFTITYKELKVGLKESFIAEIENHGEKRCYKNEQENWDEYEGTYKAPRGNAFTLYLYINREGGWWGIDSETAHRTGTIYPNKRKPIHRFDGCKLYADPQRNVSDGLRLDFNEGMFVYMAGDGNTLKEGFLSINNAGTREFFERVE